MGRAPTHCCRRFGAPRIGALMPTVGQNLYIARVRAGIRSARTGWPPGPQPIKLFCVIALLWRFWNLPVWFFRFSLVLPGSLVWFSFYFSIFLFFLFSYFFWLFLLTFFKYQNNFFEQKILWTKIFVQKYFFWTKNIFLSKIFWTQNYEQNFRWFCWFSFFILFLFLPKFPF
jgi:hypothetical protein